MVYMKLISKIEQHRPETLIEMVLRVLRGQSILVISLGSLVVEFGYK